MPVKAYLLIKTIEARKGQVLQELRGRRDVELVDAVLGPAVDIIVRVKGETPNDIEAIRRQICSMDGVTEASSYPVMIS